MLKTCKFQLTPINYFVRTVKGMQRVPSSVCKEQVLSSESISLALEPGHCVCACVNCTSLGRGSKHAERTLHLGRLPGVDGDDVRTDGDGEGGTCGGGGGDRQDDIIKESSFNAPAPFLKTHTLRSQRSAVAAVARSRR